MKKCIYGLLVMLTLASCSDSHKRHTLPGQSADAKRDENGQISVREREGVNDIINFYSCDCKYATGVTTMGSKFFELDVSKSASIEKMKDIVGLTMSNVGCIFYQNLTGTNSPYSEIHVHIEFSDGQKFEQSIPVESLEIVMAKMKTVLNAVGMLKEKNYDGLAAIMDDTSGMVKYDKNKLIGEIKKADEPLGAIKAFVPYGYAFYRNDSGGKIVLRISGVLQREKQNNEFSVILDPKSKTNNIISINYKL